MEEIDLREIFGWFWKEKIKIIIVLIIFILIGVFYTFNLVTPEYSSSSTIALTTSEEQENIEISNLTVNELNEILNSKLVLAYGEIIQSDKLITQVISNLKLEENNNIKESLEVEINEDAEIIKITVSNENAETATNIVNEMVKVLNDMAIEIYNADNIYVIDEAQISNEPTNVNHTKDIITFACIGLVISICYVLIINLFVTTEKKSLDSGNEGHKN